MAIAAIVLALLSAMESGWPPISQVASTVFVARSTWARTPEGLAKLSRVLTATSTLSPATVTEVGSPSSLTEPPAFGAFASVMSTKPIALFGLSE